MMIERIRELLEARPFVPFSLFLVDRHSIHISDEEAAWIEEGGRTLVVRTISRRENFLEIIDLAAIIRLLVKAPALEGAPPDPEPPPSPTIPPRKTRVLFICTRNSARSQIAEAWLNHLAGERIEAESAGYEPGGIHPLAIEAMRDVGIDISGQRTKSIFELYQAGKMFAYAISVCDESAEKPPVYPGTTVRLHWSFPDPLAGTEAETLERMCAVRDSLRARIAEWIQTIGDERAATRA